MRESILGLGLGLSVSVFLLGCGSGAPSQQTSPPVADGCRFGVTLSGAVSAAFDSQTALSCSYVPRSSSGELFFFPSHMTVMRLDLEIEGLVIGQTASNLKAGLKIISKSGYIWEAQDCTVNLTRSEQPGTKAVLEGKGQCPLSAEPETSGGGNVTVGSFEFKTG